MEAVYIKKLSIVIMAHPDRREMAEALSASLGDVPIVYDRKNNVWDTCRRAWLSIDSTAEYGLVLQDDTLPCRDFISRAEALLNGRFVYNFFIHSGFGARVQVARDKGDDYFIMPSIYGEIALCMPTKYILSMVKYCDRRGAQADTLISSWARDNKIRIRYPIPALVDHRIGESLFQKFSGKPQHKNPHQSCCFADNFKA